jgi:hypothetical protein
VHTQNRSEALQEVGSAVKQYLASKGWPNLSPDQVIGQHLPGIWKHLEAQGLVAKYGLSYKAMVDHAMVQRMVATEVNLEEELMKHFGGRFK